MTSVRMTNDIPSWRLNYAGLDGGIALFTQLAENPTLKILDLSGMSGKCQIDFVVTDDILTHALRWLYGHPFNLTIGVNRNHIGRAGAEALRESLKVNNTLEQLLLRENGFGIEGACIIAEGLKVCHSWRPLDEIMSVDDVSLIGACFCWTSERITSVVRDVAPSLKVSRAHIYNTCTCPETTSPTQARTP